MIRRMKGLPGCVRSAAAYLPGWEVGVRHEQAI